MMMRFFVPTRSTFAALGAWGQTFYIESPVPRRFHNVETRPVATRIPAIPGDSIAFPQALGGLEVDAEPHILATALREPRFSDPLLERLAEVMTPIEESHAAAPAVLVCSPVDIRASYWSPGLTLWESYEQRSQIAVQHESRDATYERQLQYLDRDRRTTPAEVQVDILFDLPMQPCFDSTANLFLVRAGRQTYLMDVHAGEFLVYHTDQSRLDGMMMTEADLKRVIRILEKELQTAPLPLSFEKMGNILTGHFVALQDLIDRQREAIGILLQTLDWIYEAALEPTFDAKYESHRQLSSAQSAPALNQGRLREISLQVKNLSAYITIENDNITIKMVRMRKVKTEDGGFKAEAQEEHRINFAENLIIQTILDNVDLNTESDERVIEVLRNYFKAKVSKTTVFRPVLSDSSK